MNNIHYPEQSTEQTNLDWIIRTIMRIENSVTEYMAINFITWRGDWDISKGYPKWSIVNDSNTGNGYIAIKPVPQGVDITDTRYWVKVCNYDALYAAFESRIDALERHVELETNRIYLFMGDSYAESSHWVDMAVSYLGLDSNHYYDITEGSRTFISSYTYLDKLTTFVQTHTADELNNITDLVLLGGIGDAMNEAFVDYLLWRRIVEWYNYAHEHIPNAKIQLGYIGVALTGYPGAMGTNTAFNRTRAINEYKKVVKLGGSYLNGMEYVLQRYDCMLDGNGNIVDGLHPQYVNGSGDLIAIALTECIRNGSANIEYFGETVGAFTPTGGRFACDLRCGYDNGTTFIDIRGFNCDTTTNISYSNVDLGALPNWQPVWNSDPVECSVNVTLPDNTDKVMICRFQIVEHHLNIQTGNTHAGGGQWDEIPSGSYINTSTLRFVLPTLFNL